MLQAAWREQLPDHKVGRALGVTFQKLRTSTWGHQP